MANRPRIVSCPTCAKPVRWEPANRYRPFCCERCKLIDLGEWATESYRVPDDQPLDEADPSNPAGG